MTAGDLHGAVDVDRAREREDGVARRVVASVVGAENVLVESADVALAPGDREAQGMVAVDERARKVVGVDLPPLVVEVFEDLLEDDAALDVDVEKGRFGEDLAEESARLVERFRRQRQREDPVIDLGRRVERSTEAFEREIDLVRARYAARTSIDHVFEEVADSVRLACLEARADPRPERDVGAMKRRLRRDDDAQSVRERGGVKRRGIVRTGQVGHVSIDPRRRPKGPRRRLRRS